VEALRKIAGEWKALSVEERMEYDELARLDRERYLQEI
jgi:hypothetical protein